MTSPAERSHHTVIVATAIAIAAGVSGLAGWLFGVPWLMSIAADAPALMPMSALGLLAAGIALAYAQSHPRYSQGFGALVVAIAAVAAVGYATKTDFGFGDLPEGLARGAGTLPGLPAPNSILAFVLV